MSGSSRADFDFQERVGRGASSVVFKARRKADARIYCIKEIDMSAVVQEEEEQAIREVNLLASFEHPYVIRYFDSFVDDEILHIVMEWAQHGTLADRLKAQEGTVMDELQIWKWGIQVAVGLQHMHSRHVLHRDLKSANVFITAEQDAKIGDLGVSKVLSMTHEMAHTVVGTPYYLSPELCEGRPYNVKSDVWAYGCILFEMCSGGAPPFVASNQGALILKIISGEIQSMPSRYSRELTELIESCLTKDAKLRPTSAQIISTPSVIARAASLSIHVPQPSAEAAQLEDGQPQPRSRPGSRRRELRSAPGEEEEVGERPMAREGGPRLRSRRGKPQSELHEMLVGSSDSALDRLVEQDSQPQPQQHKSHGLGDLDRESDPLDRKHAPPPAIEPPGRAATSAAKPPVHPVSGSLGLAAGAAPRGMPESPPGSSRLKSFVSDWMGPPRGRRKKSQKGLGLHGTTPKAARTPKAAAKGLSVATSPAGFWAVDGPGWGGEGYTDFGAGAPSPCTKLVQDKFGAGPGGRMTRDDSGIGLRSPNVNAVGYLSTDEEEEEEVEIEFEELALEVGGRQRGRRDLGVGVGGRGSARGNGVAESGARRGLDSNGWAGNDKEGDELDAFVLRAEAAPRVQGRPFLRQGSGPAGAVAGGGVVRASVAVMGGRGEGIEAEKPPVDARASLQVVGLELGRGGSCEARVGTSDLVSEAGRRVGSGFVGGVVRGRGGANSGQPAFPHRLKF